MDHIQTRRQIVSFLMKHWRFRGVLQDLSDIWRAIGLCGAEILLVYNPCMISSQTRCKLPSPLLKIWLREGDLRNVGGATVQNRMSNHRDLNSLWCVGRANLLALALKFCWLKILAWFRIKQNTACLPFAKNWPWDKSLGDVRGDDGPNWTYNYIGWNSLHCIWMDIRSLWPSNPPNLKTHAWLWIKQGAKCLALAKIQALDGELKGYTKICLPKVDHTITWIEINCRTRFLAWKLKWQMAHHLPPISQP